MEIDGQEELYGLPSRSRREGWLFKAFVVILLTAGAGWLAGQGYRLVRLRLFLESAQTALRQSHPNRFRIALDGLQASFGSLRDNSVARATMGRVYLRASSLLPQRTLYLQSALNELNGALQTADADSPERILIQLRRSFALMELNRDTEALAAIDRGESQLMSLGVKDSPPGFLSLRQSFINARAYLYAVAQDSAVRSPEQALALAQEMIAMPILDENNTPTSRNPILLDTVAEAYYASGQPEQALNVQRTAVVLADNTELYIYLKHFDTYRAAAKSMRK